MHLGELNENEQRVLCALVGHMIRADGQLTDEEIDAMSQVADEMGLDQWRAAFRAVLGKYPDTESVIALAQSVTRNEARDRIVSVLGDVARSDALDASETRFLGALTRSWD
jgi:uncharacterized tellurite resistance protein B-like protein